ncbi:transcriptional regulator [Amylibacter sp. IMCC11727]|uniref:transcriptional regulator n=1 Tax=Amylibacter sp. IMCC11727 TaxID=3039851 RepID=UPI00244E54A6|nr:transcriptional regulator [Amylibacter sp. IMCC11727]WGI21383.1 transcriptional regulator [Amylibacter sp. IMCC11727]
MSEGKVSKLIKIQAIGPFQVLGPDATPLTPKGSKACALLAILALTDGKSRPRRFLEEKLWSGRAPEQAGQSLRQELTQIRRALGDHTDCFIVDRSTVRLDPELVSVDYDDFDGTTHKGRELLEGLLVRDTAFEGWLQEVRGAFDRRKSALVARNKGLVLRTRTSDPNTGASGILGDVLANQIGQNIAEQVRAWRHVNVRMAETDQDAAEIEIDAQVAEEGGQSLAFIRLTHAQTGRVLHTQKAQVDASSMRAATEDLLADITVEAAEKTLDAMANTFPSERPELASAAMARRAVREMETFEASRLDVADRLLRSAYDIDQNGLFLAWQSLLKTIQLTELLSTNRSSDLEMIEGLNRKALEMDGDNPLVQALVNQVQVLMFTDLGAANAVASQQLDPNLSGAFSLSSLASANMWEGDAETAYQLTKKATDLAGRSSFHHWWDTFHCISCIASGRYEEAIQFGESAARVTPNFRPPLRHLLALYAHMGDRENMWKMVAALKRLEPDFSLERFKFDETYPVRTLRRANLLNFPVEEP